MQPSQEPMQYKQKVFTCTCMYCLYKCTIIILYAYIIIEIEYKTSTCTCMYVDTCMGEREDNTFTSRNTGAVLDETQTHDHQVSRPVLYQLSHQGSSAGWGESYMYMWYMVYVIVRTCICIRSVHIPSRSGISGGSTLPLCHVSPCLYPAASVAAQSPSSPALCSGLADGSLSEPPTV